MIHLWVLYTIAQVIFKYFLVISQLIYIYAMISEAWQKEANREPAQLPAPEKNYILLISQSCMDCLPSSDIGKVSEPSIWLFS